MICADCGLEHLAKVPCSVAQAQARIAALRSVKTAAPDVKTNADDVRTNVADVKTPVKTVGFDRGAWMREYMRGYMRKRRAAEKSASA